MLAPERLRPEETARVVRSSVVVALRAVLKFVVNAAQVVVALRAVFQALSKPVPESAPFILKVSLNVEEAFTKMPARVEVGVIVFCPAKATCQAPGLPPLPPVAVVQVNAPLSAISWRKSFPVHAVPK